MSMKKSNVTIGNRTRDLPACSAGPQPTALPRAPLIRSTHYKISEAFDATCFKGWNTSLQIM